MNPSPYRYPGDEQAVAAALAAAGPAAAHVTAADVRGLAPFRRLTSLVGQACHGDRPGPERLALLDAAAAHLAALELAVDAAHRVLHDAWDGLRPADTDTPQGPPDPA